MIYITEIFERIVSRTAEVYGSSVNYYYGHPKEINNILTINNKVRKVKYPAIFFFLGEDVERVSTANFGTFSPDFAIVHETKGTYITADRIENKFKPVIWPIYEAFLQAINESREVYNNGDKTFLEHSYHNHYFYGSDSNTEGKKLFDDTLDAMTINFNSLSINLKC